MTVLDVCEILNCKILCGEDCLDNEVLTACGSDMMSDVLAYVKDQSVLLTGLVNSQVIRTADMMDMVCIVLVRGKVPTEDMLALAKQRSIALVTTELRMFPACGLLWANGLRGGEAN